MLPVVILVGAPIRIVGPIVTARRGGRRNAGNGAHGLSCDAPSRPRCRRPPGSGPHDRPRASGNAEADPGARRAPAKSASAIAMRITRSFDHFYFWPQAQRCSTRLVSVRLAPTLAQVTIALRHRIGSEAAFQLRRGLRHARPHKVQHHRPQRRKVHVDTLHLLCRARGIRPRVCIARFGEGRRG